MTDKRTIKFEINVDADAKGVDRFAKSLKNLQESAPIADKELKKIRQGILDFVAAAGTSEKVTAAAAASLKNLRTEAQAGGALWKQLGKDVDNLARSFNQATGAAKTLQQQIAAPVGNTFEKLGTQVGKLKTELNQLNIRSKEYVQTLTRIKELESVGSFNQGRLSTIAANQAFMGATMTRGYGAASNLPSLPDTIAGDSQRVAELTQRIQNLDRGSEEYLNTVKQLATAQAQLASSQAQLNRAVNDSANSYDRANAALQRRDAKLRAIAEYESSQNIAQRRNDGFADRPQSQRLDNGTFIAPPFRSSSYNNIGDAGRGQFGPESPEDYRRRIDPLIAAVNESNQELIRAKNQASRSLAEQEARLARERDNQADQLNRQYLAQEDRRFQAELRDFDNRLQARERKQKEAERRRVNRRRALQEIGGVATAVGVGGFFGGVEGGVGAVAGGLIGGVGGAQAGATLGLGIASGRQAIAGFATQAAELNKLRIALRSVVGTQAEYEVSLRTIDQANRELNIPLAQGTRQFTQLAAAVVGAGGNVSDAALAFNAVNSAIKATGGSSQDADGALRAVVQTFSKGKVSAEELRGQLGERLPGAVTLFAASIGKTGPELDKALEKGEVGLNDFIKFLARLDKDFSQTARNIAASGDEAGTRLQLTFERTALVIGEAFKPLGEAIQTQLTGWLKDNESNIKRWAEIFVDSVRTVFREVNRLAQALRESNEALRFVMNGGNAYDFFTSRELEKKLGGFSVQDWWKQIGGNAQSRAQIEMQIRDVEGSIKRLQGIELRGGSADLINQQILQQQAKLARLQTGLQRLREPAAPAPTNFPGAAGDPAAADDRKAEAEADRQRRLAEQLAAERQRLAEAQAQQEIRLAETVYRARVELDNAQYANRRRLEDLQARAQMAYLSPTQRDAMSATLEFQRLRNEDSDRLREIDQRIKELNLSITNARKMAEVTAMAATVPVTAAPQAITGGGGNAFFGSTGNVRNARGWVHGHFQTNTGTLAQLIADTAPVVMALIRAGVPAELANGVKFRPGMTEEDIKRLLYQGAKLHRHSGDGRSVDVFVPEGTRMPVPLMDVQNTGGRGGVTGVLPGSGNVWVGHLAPNSRSGGAGGLVRTPTGVAAQERRATVDMGDVKVLEVQRDALKALREEEEKGIKDRLGAQMTISIAERTQALRDNTVSIRENVQQMQDRARFTAEGFADYEVEALTEINRKQRESNELIAYYTKQKRLAEETKNKDGVEYFTRAIQEQTKYLEENRQALLAQAQAQRELNEAAGKGIGFREGARQYVESIGTMREATAALTSTGLKGVEDMLVSLATTGTANFREFAASLLRDTTRLVIQQLILKTILQAIGAIGGPSLPTSGGGLFGAALAGSGGGGLFGAASAGIGALTLNAKGNVYPFAKGGVVEQPTLFKFAKGTGLMGEAGPEAIMPLKRGPDGRLGVSGGGGVNVTVNVSMDGGQSTDADSAQGAQLGRAVALAVQQELIKQKRPGGLLTK